MSNCVVEFNRALCRAQKTLEEEISERSPIYKPLASALIWIDDMSDSFNVQAAFTSFAEGIFEIRDGLDASRIGSRMLCQIINDELQSVVGSAIEGFVDALADTYDAPEPSFLLNWGVALVVGILGMDYVASFDLAKNTVVTRVPFKRA